MKMLKTLKTKKNAEYYKKQAKNKYESHYSMRQVKNAAPNCRHLQLSALPPARILSLQQASLDMTGSKDDLHL